MDNDNATEKCNTNLESSEPGLQDRLYLKLLGPTLESKNCLEMLLRILSANIVKFRGVKVKRVCIFSDFC